MRRRALRRGGAGRCGCCCRCACAHEPAPQRTCGERAGGTGPDLHRRHQLCVCQRRDRGGALHRDPRGGLGFLRRGAQSHHPGLSALSGRRDGERRQRPIEHHEHPGGRDPHRRVPSDQRGLHRHPLPAEPQRRRLCRVRARDEAGPHRLQRAGRGEVLRRLLRPAVRPPRHRGGWLHRGGGLLRPLLLPDELRSGRRLRRGAHLRPLWRGHRGRGRTHPGGLYLRGLVAERRGCSAARKHARREPQLCRALVRVRSLLHRGLLASESGRRCVQRVRQRDH